MMIQHRIRTWLQRPRYPQEGWVTLDHRHLYILPTWLGIWFSVLLITMLLASLNFNLNLGLILTFTLISISLGSMWFAYRNVQNLKVGHANQSAIFANQPAVLSVTARNKSKHSRFGIAIRYQKHTGEDYEVHAEQDTVILVPIGHLKRGIHPIKRIKIAGEFPFRLFHVWSYADLAQQITVYPAPEEAYPPLPSPDQGEDTTGQRTKPDDELPELIRPYQLGDTLKQIAWKHSARSDELVSRYGEAQVPSNLWLDWRQTASEKDTELRLSRLCAWVIDAEAQGLQYGLSLPGVQLMPNKGDAHLHQCLTALAAWRG